MGPLVRGSEVQALAALGAAEEAIVAAFRSQISLGDMAGAVRVLATDAVTHAECGDAAYAVRMSDVASVLYARFLKVDPADGDWPDRDRVVVSARPGSLLLYALLHLCGYPDIDIDDIQAFRQLGAKTAGHPEYGVASGIEATTGPLGQGFATAVGLALAERLGNARCGDALVDHFTYVFAGEGCLTEGIAQEAAELAGEFGLSRLVVFYDAPMREGSKRPSFISTTARFEAAGWAVHDVDAGDHAAIEQAIASSRAADRPTLIVCRSGMPRSGQAVSFGAVSSFPAGMTTPQAPQRRPFEVAEPVLRAWRKVGSRGAAAHAVWQRHFEAADDDVSQRLLPPSGVPQAVRNELQQLKLSFAAARPAISTRKAVQRALALIAPLMPRLVGGSAGMPPRTDLPVLTRGAFSGRHVDFGAREHAMAAAMNGLALAGFIPYGFGLLAFSDYARPAIRLGALMGLRTLHFATHDSIGLGEDGPTHQPVEHLASLRAMPNLAVMRPADAVEVAECLLAALEQEDTPSVICLSRQALPTLRTSVGSENQAARGAYLIAGATADRDVTIIATGSEVQIAVRAAERLAAEGIKAAVVSMPCVELFRIQPREYQKRVLGVKPRIVVEAGVRDCWDRFLGEEDVFIGMDEFGASGPAEDLFDCFGITVEAVTGAARRFRN